MTLKIAFYTIKHKEIIRGLKRRIDCPYTIILDKKGRKKTTIIKSDIGIPQGIVVSPLFSNIVLHELDRFIEKDLKLNYTVGKDRKANKEYRRISY